MNEKTALEQLEYWIEQYYRINGTPTLDDIKGQINLLKDYEREQLHIANPLSVVLTEEEKELIYQNERKKYEGSSWEVELDYHKETFMSGIDALIDFLNNR